MTQQHWFLLFLSHHFVSLLHRLVIIIEIQIILHCKEPCHFFITNVHLFALLLAIKKLFFFFFFFLKTLLVYKCLFGHTLIPRLWIDVTLSTFVNILMNSRCDLAICLAKHIFTFQSWYKPNISWDLAFIVLIWIIIQFF